MHTISKLAIGVVFAFCAKNNSLAQTKDHIIKRDAATSVYCNPRFGYCIDFPAGVLYPQREAENGDGRVFLDKHNKEVLSVWGRRNMDPEGNELTLQQKLKEDIKYMKESSKTQIIYQKLGKTFFVVTGITDGQIFYQKTILKDGAFATAYLKYANAEKDIYDKISERIFKSFK